MPYTKKQHKLFEAAAHSPKVAKRVKIPVTKAKKMASEGVKNVGMGRKLTRARTRRTTS